MDSATITLTPAQTQRLNRLYKSRTVKTNGGQIFGVLGQAFIDPENTAGQYGTAKFYWLNQKQYEHVKKAILEALKFDPDPVAQKESE